MFVFRIGDTHRFLEIHLEKILMTEHLYLLPAYKKVKTIVWKKKCIIQSTMHPKNKLYT